MVGDSAAGRWWLWNNLVASSRSPEVVNSHPNRSGEFWIAAEGCSQHSDGASRWEMKWDVNKWQVMHIHISPIRNYMLQVTIQKAFRGLPFRNVLSLMNKYCQKSKLKNRNSRERYRGQAGIRPLD